MNATLTQQLRQSVQREQTAIANERVRLEEQANRDDALFFAAISDPEWRHLFVRRLAEYGIRVGDTNG